MQKSIVPPGFLDLRDYFENRPRIPAAELAKYAGKRVAFSIDGKRVVASGLTTEDVENELAVAGIDASQVIHSYITPLDESSVG